MKVQPTAAKQGRTRGLYASLIALAGFIACAAPGTGDDTDENKNAYIDNPAQDSTDGAGPTTGGGTTSGGGMTGTTSTSTGMPMGCEYPAGPYGVKQNDTLPPSLKWQGFGPGETSPRWIEVTEFFDCDGSRGIHAVLIDTSQYG